MDQSDGTRLKGEKAPMPASLHEVASEALAEAITVSSDHLSEVMSWHAHVPFIFPAIAFLRPRCVVELGVHKGDSYISMLLAMRKHGVEGVAFGVDTWAGDAHAGGYDGAQIFAEVAAKSAPFSEFSNLLRKTFDEAVADVADGSVDLLHIDGLHTYEAVRHDFETWKPKLSDRAVVLFHDTAVKEGDFGVWRFWREVEHKYPSYNFQYGNGLGVLCVGPEVPAKFLSLVMALNEGSRDASARDPAAWFAAVGESYAARIDTQTLLNMLNAARAEEHAIRAAGQAEINRLNAELTEVQRAGQVEIDRLNAELATLAPGSPKQRTEFDRLNGELTEARRAGQAEIDRLNAELSDVRRAGQAEIDRLNAEMSEARGVAQSKIDRLSAELSETKRAGQAEVDLLNAELAALPTGAADWQREIARLSAELAEARRAGQAEIDRLNAEVIEVRSAAGLRRSIHAKLRSVRSRLALKKERGIVRAKKVVRATIGAIPSAAVRRFTYARLSSLRSLLRRGHDNTLDGQLYDPGEHYVRIASCANGRPKAPPRTVSIIIPVYNKIEYTLQCLEAIKRNTAEIEHEIIVVDDGSSDETQFELGTRDDIIYIRNTTNLGFIGSCNAGARRATKTYLCYLNNDTEVGPSWLSALVNTFELHEGVGLVGSKLIYPDGRLQEAGGIIWDDFSGWNWGKFQDPADPKFNYARTADYCSGAALMIPRALADALGGFDPHFTPAYGEDSDLAFRVRSLGLKVIYQPVSQVVHFEGITSGTDINSGVKAYQVRNAEKLKQRWLPCLPLQGENGVNVARAVDRGMVGKVLVLDQISPEPDCDAGSLTALEIMRGLRDLGYKVTFAPVSNFTFIPKYTDTLCALGIESLLYPWTSSMAQHLKSHGADYDAVVIFRVGTATDYLPLVKKWAPQAKVIFHTSDLHFLREERAVHVRRGAAAAPSNGQRERELRIIEMADQTIVHSHFEKQLLAELCPSARITVFPWIYGARGEGKDFGGRKDVVFLGGFRHDPNVDAVHFFAQEIFEQIKRHIPDAKFHVVGSNPPASFSALSEASDVVVHGFVEDIEPILASTRLMVVPLRYGAGLKGKIVTAMAHGLPVVTTSVGAEGMALEDGKHVLIADEAEAFAAATVKLYNNEALWTSLRGAGLDYVEKHTSRAAGLAIIHDIVRSVGLPSIAVSPPMLSRASPFGTPPALTDEAALFEALGVKADIEADALREVLATKGWALSSGGAGICGIVDSTSMQCVQEAVTALAATKGALSLAFAPPRLVATEYGFEVKRPFSNDDANNVAAPVHEKYAAALAGLGDDVVWRCDTTILGGPTIWIAERKAHA